MFLDQIIIMQVTRKAKQKQGNAASYLVRKLCRTGVLGDGYGSGLGMHAPGHDLMRTLDVSVG